MKAFLLKLFSEVDNSTPDISKILMAVAVLIALVLTVLSSLYPMIKFDIVAYGSGIAQLFVAAAAIFHFKKDSNATN